MSILVETFLQNGGNAKFFPCAIEGKNILLFGGFIQDFVTKLKSVNIDLTSNNIHRQREVFLLHPLHFNPYPCITHFLYEVGCDESISALLAHALCPENLKDSKTLENLDVGHLSSECNLSEEELESIAHSFKQGRHAIIIGTDLNTHKKSKNIAKILAFLSHSVEIVFLESTQDSKPSKPIDKNEEIETLEEPENYDGLVVYLQKSTQGQMILESSKQFCTVGKMQENLPIHIRFLDSKREVDVLLKCNADIKGMVGILWIPRDFELQKDFCYQLISKVA